LALYSVTVVNKKYWCNRGRDNGIIVYMDSNLINGKDELVP